MLVNFKKEDVMLETSGLCSNISTYDDTVQVSTPTSVRSLKFEGFTGFNEKYVTPLFDFFANTPTGDSYKVIRVAGNLHNDDSIHTATFFIIKNLKGTNFLFKTLKSFGISLPDLRLGYECNDSNEITVLYLDRKILRILSSLDVSNRNELTLYFYCLVKWFIAFNTVCPELTTQDLLTSVIADSALNKLYKEYGNIPDVINVECIQLKEDVFFGDVLYINNRYSHPTKSGLDLKLASSYVYNVLKAESTETLCIVNTTTKEFYLIDMDKGTVYTNNELKEYNTFDYLEWLPNLIANICEIKNKPFYRIKYSKLESLLSTKSPEIVISTDASNFESLLERYSYITENNNIHIYDGYFKGSKIISDAASSSLKDQYDSDPYAQELYKQVQPYYETFDLKDLTGIVKGIVNGDVYSMLFEGESGTGKSTAARVIATRCGIPFIAINCSTNIEESDMIGTFIPNPKKQNPEDPEFIWQDGALTKAVRNGYVGIIEELGGARPGILMKLNSLLDESRQLDLPNGEVLKAHKNFRIIATTNIGYEGTNRLNKALVNRFEICKKFVDLDEKEAKAVIIARTGYTDVDKINKIFDIYKAIKKYSDEQNLGLVISIRQLLTLFKQGKYYKTASDAVNNLLLNQAFLEEPEHLKYFKDVVLKALDTSFKL